MLELIDWNAVISYLVGIVGFFYALYKYVKMHGIGRTIFAALIRKLGKLDQELLKARAASLAKKMATIIKLDLFDGNLDTVAALESYLDGIIKSKDTAIPVKLTNA